MKFCVKVRQGVDAPVIKEIMDKGYPFADHAGKLIDATSIYWLYFDGEKVRACENYDAWHGGYEHDETYDFPGAAVCTPIHPADIFDLEPFEAKSQCHLCKATAAYFTSVVRDDEYMWLCDRCILPHERSRADTAYEPNRKMQIPQPFKVPASKNFVDQRMADIEMTINNMLTWMREHC
ncbi:unnamed protein product [marine sediment metagenome]|uniref:Uncharacterized protein n=1 Tax=marine sediment metagenome TaxID=412755 RepID=X0W0Q5_9ZZZZ